MSAVTKSGHQKTKPNPTSSTPSATARFRESSRTTASPARTKYERFWAGYHGLSGIAAYVGSPSFAIGERLNKADAKLLGGIAKGHGVMPAWADLLSIQDRLSILGYIRTLPDRYRKGIALPRRDPPERYFSFGPMNNTELGR